MRAVHKHTRMSNQRHPGYVLLNGVARLTLVLLQMSLRSTPATRQALRLRVATLPPTRT